MACATLIEPSVRAVRERQDPEAASAATFHRLLAWLDGGVESGGERYLEMRRRLVGYFDRRNRIYAEDLADETLNRIGRILVRDGAIDVPPERFCYVVAKFVLLEDFRRERRDNIHRTAQVDEQSVPEAPEMDEEYQQREARLERLEASLQHLSADQRGLIVEYYRETGGSKIARRRDMAKRLGISSNALAIRAARIRRKLEDWMTGR